MEKRLGFSQKGSILLVNAVYIKSPRKPHRRHFEYPWHSRGVLASSYGCLLLVFYIFTFNNQVPFYISFSRFQTPPAAD